MSYYIWGIVYLWLGVALLLIGMIQWKPWSNPLKQKKRRSALIFATSIVVGGLFTTKGWNQFSAHQQDRQNAAFKKELDERNKKFKEDLDQRDQAFKAYVLEREAASTQRERRGQILSVARDWRFNELVLQRKPFTYYLNDPNNELRNYDTLLPQFRNSQLGSIATSPLFRLDDPNDMKFLVAVINYNDTINTFNYMFALVDHAQAPIKNNLKQEWLTKFFGENGQYRDFLYQHRVLKDTLEKAYPWVFEDVKIIKN